MKAIDVLREILTDKRHLLILGQTRAGKTTVSKKLVSLALKLGFTVYIVDWRNEYKIDGIVSLPFILPKKTLPSLLSAIVAEESRTAGSLTWLALDNIVDKIKTFEDLINSLLLQATDRDLRLGAIAALARLKPLHALNPDFYEHFERLPSGRWNLSFLDFYTKKNIANLISAALYEALRLDNASGRNTILVLEESHHYLPATQLLREGAFYNVKLVEIRQTPPEDQDLILNSNLIVFNLGVLARKIVLQYAWEPRILKLREHEFAVYSCKRRKWLGPFSLNGV